MGVVSGAALEAGGEVTGVVPFAMVAVGGEIDQVRGTKGAHVLLKEAGREKVRLVRFCYRCERGSLRVRRSVGGNCECSRFSDVHGRHA